MHIDKIHIQNFKSFANETFELNRHFTVFIGDNAKGKTSILDALAIAVGSFFIGIEGVTSRTIQSNEIRVKTIDGQPKPQKPVCIESTWIVSDEDKQVWKDDFLNEKMVWTREIQKDKTTTKNARMLSHWAEQLVKKSREKSGVIFPVIAYHGTGRLWALHEKIDYQKQKEGVVMAYTNALSAKSSPKEFLDWFKTLEDSVKKFDIPLDIAHLKAFKKVITSLIPDGRWQDVTFDFKEDDLTGVFTSDTGQKEKLKYSQLSDGYRNIIALAADIAYRCIQLNPHLGEKVVEETPGIVLIDELDLHLHPNWQKQIVKDLKKTFPRIQFVATTHSPFIVQSLNADELINLDKEEVMSQSPDELPLSKVATEIMGVENIRSDNFEERYRQAKEELQKIENQKQGQVLSLDDYQNISKQLGKLIKDETNDPFYKAYLDTKDQDETDS